MGIRPDPYHALAEERGFIRKGLQRLYRRGFRTLW
jgi:hypothetical protein